jgi:branched-chain amino acid transport system ATP-binding protein
MADVLRLAGVTAGYRDAVILQDVDLELQEGQSIALLGRNGVGKTTLINTIVGVTRRFAGAIVLAGQDITRVAPEWRAAAGLGWVPQERNIFRSLTVLENLTAIARPGPWTPARVFEMFPRLGERRNNMGTQLSGGEQQMLALGRALVLNPRVLLLDEPLEGLAPIIVAELLQDLSRILKDEGMACIVVEQHAQKILAITDHAIILDRGMIVHRAPSSVLRADPATLEHYLGVAKTPARSNSEQRPQPAV